MKTTAKKIVSVFLVALMIVGMVPVSVFAAETTPTVNIVSFMRGEQANLRSSELLEARVTGYDGNVLELTYKWYNTLGTYLYVYNSHNMYHINNTDGEIEIYNTAKNMSGLSNMVGRTYANSFSGIGYAWASIYGANISKNTLQGTITVEVYDKNGELLCSDSHTGTGSGNNRKGIVSYSLDSDMDNVVIGIFEGEKKNVKDLLGESAIVHITCVASTVASGKIISGSEHISLTKESDGDYYITGTTAGTSTTLDGDAKVELKITKDNCKFHNESSGDAVTTTFVFKKPTTETTTTTLTLTGNLDDRCEYFIGGAKGTKQDDGTIIFTGLTPNTNYTVEVRGEYKDNNNNTKYAYAYVYDTTKPVYSATVYTYLDGVKTDIGDIHKEGVILYLHEDKENAEYIELEHTDTGTYAAAVTNGIYFPWHADSPDHYHQAREYKLIIENANGELNLHHYSVNYDTNGGNFKTGEDVVTENYSSMSTVYATENVPVRDGYIFTGWEYNNETIASGAVVTENISNKIILTAKWEKAVNVTINVTIDHKADGGYDTNSSRDELVVEFLEMTKDSPAFIETGDVLNFSKDDVTDENGNSMPFNYSYEEESGEITKTIYTAIAPTYEGLLESSYFGVALSKSGYDVGIIEKIQDENGNWTINIPLEYNPDDFNLDFSIKMEESVPKELYPDAVIIKIACWSEEDNAWVIITQQRGENKPGVRVDIDETTGEGSGSYPVWKFDSADHTVPYGYRAVVSGFIYDKSTIVVPTEKDLADNVVTYTDGNYTAVMGDITDGKTFGTILKGAYYDSTTDSQKGTLDGEIVVEKYDVTFDAQGGTVNGGATDTAKDQYYIPSFDNYIPTMDEHEFKGWYTDKDCTMPATEGELLTQDITLYAEWDRIITGNVIVDAYYDSHEVNHSDRATHALIELEEITPDGTYNIAGVTVEIEWIDGEHYSIPVDYKFTGLDPDKTYRIDVYLINYDTTYQNSTTVKTDDGDIINDYNISDYTAIYQENSKWETYVNTLLEFNPETYFQNVEVDATRIGERFRPDEVLVEYLGKEAGTDNDYSIIIQHEVAPFGVEVGMGEDGNNDGIYGCEIWKKIANGKLYDYQANLTKIDGVSLNDYPVIVVYGDSVRWSPYNQAPTDSLKVTIIPMWYNVIYDWNTGDGQSTVDTRGHVWSHESVINYSDDYIPVRDGYIFKGWYANPECTGEKVTTIAAEVHNDTTVYAKWEKRTDLELTVEHIIKDTETVLGSETKTSQTFGDVIIAENLKKDFTGYIYDSASAASVTITTGINNITLYYTANSYGYTVNYLEDGTDKVLASAKTGTADFNKTVTENAIAIDGYTVTGESSKSIVIDTENNVINFYYTANSYGYTVNYLEDGTDKILASAKTGTADFNTIVTEQAIVINGYAVVGHNTKSTIIDIDSNVINFYYGTDLSGAGENGTESDGIPDRYQKKIIFKVVNGKWNDSTTVDIVTYVTLMTAGKFDENGIAELVAPEGMIADSGFGNGKWEIVPPKTVSGTNEEKFTYIFIEMSAEPENPNSGVEIPGNINIGMGESVNIGDVINPENGKEPIYSSSNNSVVKVDSDGNITGVIPGRATITVDLGNGDIRVIQITVLPNTSSDSGSGSLKNYICFGKTEGIGWYRVSRDGGKTYEIVFGNSTIEAAKGEQLTISVGDLPIDTDTYAFYVNEQYMPADENGNIVITVNGYMLIRAVGYTEYSVPDDNDSNNEEPKLNWFQKIIKAIKEFFAKLFGL